MRNLRSVRMRLGANASPWLVCTSLWITATMSACASAAATPHLGEPTTNSAVGDAPPTASEATSPTRLTPAHLTTESLLVERNGRTAIRRSALLALQQRGGQHFIQLVRARPYLTNNRFRGWRIIDYRGPGRLSPGDIVLRVNEQSIERPEEFIAVWDSMVDRDTLVVELVRAGARHTLSFPIVDAD